MPDWANTATVEVNGAAVSVDIRPSTWAAVSRTWRNGDRITIRVPLRLRAEAVDKQHPDRVAILYGPVALVEASPSGLHELTALPALSSKTWNLPAIAGEYLLVRNDLEAVCYRLPVRGGR